MRHLGFASASVVVSVVACVLSGASGLAPRAWADDPKSTDDPIVVLLGQLKDDQPVEARLAALKEAAATDDARLIAPLAKLLKADEDEVRLAAVKALATRTMPDTKKRAASALLERAKTVQQALEKDLSRKEELVAVVKGLHDLAQESTIDGLLDGVEMGVDLDIVEARAMAVANVPVAKAVEELIDYMARRHRDGTGIRGRLAKALTYATGAKQPNDVDAWRAWWKVAKTSFDFQAAADARAAARDAKAAKDEARDAAKKKAAEPKAKRSKGETTPPKDGAPPTEGSPPTQPSPPKED